jgi:hypothetical protein
MEVFLPVVIGLTAICYVYSFNRIMKEYTHDMTVQDMVKNAVLLAD